MGVEFEAINYAEDGAIGLVTLIGNLLELEVVFGFVNEADLITFLSLVVFWVEESVNVSYAQSRVNSLMGFLSPFSMT